LALGQNIDLEGRLPRRPVNAGDSAGFGRKPRWPPGSTGRWRVGFGGSPKPLTQLLQLRASSFQLRAPHCPPHAPCPMPYAPRAYASKPALARRAFPQVGRYRPRPETPACQVANRFWARAFRDARTSCASVGVASAGWPLGDASFEACFDRGSQDRSCASKTHSNLRQQAYETAPSHRHSL